MTSDNILLDAVKSRYEEEKKTKDSIENKAQKIITLLSILLPIGIAILTSQNFLNFPYLSSDFSVTVCVLLGLLSLLFAILSFRTTKYSAFFEIGRFVDKQNYIKESALGDFLELSNEEQRNQVIRSYLLSINKNYQTNKIKGYCLNISYFLLMVFLLLFVFVIGSSIFY